MYTSFFQRLGNVFMRSEDLPYEIIDCDGDTCHQGAEALENGEPELEFNGKFLIDDFEEVYKGSVVKAHLSPHKIWTEIRIIRTLGAAANVLNFLSYPEKHGKVIIGAPTEFLYFVAAFEGAEYSYDDLAVHCFKDDEFRVPSMGHVRRICQGVVNGLKYFHNNHYTHGNVTKDCIRWTKSVTKHEHIVVKITNFGLAQKQKVALNDVIFKQEVFACGALLRSLLFKGQALIEGSGNLEMFIQMTNAMTCPDLQNAPSLELVSTCLFLMNDIDRASFVFNAAQSMQSDLVYASAVVKKLNYFRTNNWQDKLPLKMKKYIERNDQNFKKQIQADTLVVLKFNIDKHPSLFGPNAQILFTLAYNTKVANNYMISARYKHCLLDLLRFARNIMAHMYNAEISAALSISGHSHDTFVHYLLEQVTFFGAETEALVHALKHDNLRAFKIFAGNQALIIEGGGSMFPNNVVAQRANRTEEAYNEFKETVRRTITNAMVHRPDDWCEDDIVSGLFPYEPATHSDPLSGSEDGW